MASTADMADIPQAVPWHRLRAWIDENEHYEITHYEPAPLSRAVLAAVSVIIRFDDDEPKINGDHVSALMHFIQARRMMPPEFIDIGPFSEMVHGHPQPKWRCVCTIEGHGSFPDPNRAEAANRANPYFQSKKNAKQYAAKLALDHLRLQSKPVPAKRKLACLKPSSPSPGTLSTTATVGAKSPVQAPAMGSTVAVKEEFPTVDDEEPEGGYSIFRQVSSLALKLGFEAPGYRLEPDESMPNFFNGSPVFSPGTCIPVGLGVVSGVLGKKQAKIMVAEQVYEWLQEEEGKRNATFRDLFS